MGPDGPGGAVLGMDGAELGLGCVWEVAVQDGVGRTTQGSLIRAAAGHLDDVTSIHSIWLEGWKVDEELFFVPLLALLLRHRPTQKKIGLVAGQVFWLSGLASGRLHSLGVTTDEL